MQPHPPSVSDEDNVYVEATLNKNGYFAGDDVNCLLSFTARTSNSVIEWASVQVHGHVSFDSRFIAPPDGWSPGGGAAHPPNKSTANGHAQSVVSFDRMFGARAYRVNTTSVPDVKQESPGMVLFETPAEVVVCALEATCGTKSYFSYQMRLPDCLPPSMRGTSIRYWYLLTVCTKVLGLQKITVLKVPIRVFGTVGGPDQITMDMISNTAFGVRSFPVEPKVALCPKYDPRVLKLRNLRLDEPDCFNSQSLQDPDAPKPNVYNIGNGSSQVARLYVYRPSCQPGELVSLTFDFTNSTIKCLMISLALERTEKPIQRPALQSVFAPLTEESKHTTRGSGSWKTCIVTHHAFVAEKSTYTVTVPIPSDTIPNFTTEMVSVETTLKFEFKTEKRDMNLSGNKTASSHQDKHTRYEEEDSHLLQWSLPVQVQFARGGRNKQRGEANQQQGPSYFSISPFQLKRRVSLT